MFTINEVNLYGVARYLVAQRGKICLRIFYTDATSPDFVLLMQAKAQNSFHKVLNRVKQKVEYYDYYGKDVDTQGLSVINVDQFAFIQPYIVGKTVRTRVKIDRLQADFGVTIKPQQLGQGIVWDTSILTFRGMQYKYTPQLTKDLTFQIHENRYLVSEHKKNIFILPITVWRHIPAEMMERVVLDTQTGMLTIRFSHIYENMYINGKYVWDMNRSRYVTQEYKETEITGYKEA